MPPPLRSPISLESTRFHIGGQVYCGAIMTIAEMGTGLHLLAIAGSEMVATEIFGTINYLCQNPAVLKTLTDENEIPSAVFVEANLYHIQCEPIVLSDRES